MMGCWTGMYRLVRLLASFKRPSEMSSLSPSQRTRRVFLIEENPLGDLERRAFEVRDRV